MNTFCLRNERAGSTRTKPELVRVYNSVLPKGEATMCLKRTFVTGLMLMLIASSLFASPDIIQGPNNLSAGEGRGNSGIRSDRQLDQTSVVWEYNFDDPENSMDDWTFRDASDQESYWRASEYEPYTGEGHSWTCAPSGFEGSYAGGMVQGLITPALDLSGIEMPILTFQMRLQTEFGCDGGCVMIWYGDSEEEAVRAVLSPMPRDPQYNGEVSALSDAFGEPTMGWSGDGSIAPREFTEWDGYTFFLSEYNAPYVRIGFIFASDANEEVGSGMFIDLVSVGDGMTNFPFRNDCNDNWTDGGDFEIVTGSSLADPSSLFPNTFTFFNDENAETQGFASNSTPNCMGPAEYGSEFLYEHYIQGPSIELPALTEEQDNLLFSFSVKTGFDNGAADPWQVFYYVPEFRVDGASDWQNVNAINGGAYYAFSQRLNDGEWASSLDYYNDGDWDFNISALQNQTVDFRFRVVGQGVDLVNGTNLMGTPINGSWDHLVWDDLKITMLTLEHDISTEVIVPFPNTVGYPVPITGRFTNCSPRLNEEEVNGTCEIGPMSGFLLPSEPFSINSLEYVDRSLRWTSFEEPHLNNQWAPFATSSIEEPFTISVNHTLETDENSFNDEHQVNLVIDDVGTYELGYDGRLQAASATLLPGDASMAVRIDPNDFEWFDPETDLTLKGVVASFLLDDDGLIPMPQTITWSIREDGDTPETTEIWNSNAVEVFADASQGFGQILRHDLAEEDYVTLPFEPFWIVVTKSPDDSRFALMENHFCLPENNPYYSYVDGEWVSTGEDVVIDSPIRAVVGGNIMPYLVFNSDPADGADLDLTEDQVVTFSWTGGGSPDGEMVTNTLHLEDEDGNTYTYDTSEAMLELDFAEENLPDGEWSWYVEVAEESGCSRTSEATTFSVIYSSVESSGLPRVFALEEAYPNPFNPTTTLRYQVPRLGHVELTVTNVLGQEVARLVDGKVQPGVHTAVFDGASLASGMYFVHMRAGGFSAMQKIMLMK